MSRAETVAVLMAELTGRFESLAAEAAELQQPRQQNPGRVAAMRSDTLAAMRLIDAVIVLRRPAHLDPEWRRDE